MKLVINAVNISPGGGLSVLLGLLEGLKQIGVNIEIAIFSRRSASWAALETAGWKSYIRKVEISNAMVSQLWEKTQLPKLLVKEKAHVLLTNNYHIPDAPCPQVVHHQNLWTLFAKSLWPYIIKGPRRLAQTLGARKALEKAQANVFISQYMRTCAEAINPESQPRNHVIYNGLTADFIESAETPNSVKSFSPILCAVQAPSLHKDNDSLLLTLVELLKMAPGTNWQLRIAGPGNWDSWQRKSRKLRIADRVKFLGLLDLKGIMDLFRQSACLIYPSVFEGFGMPLIEAMACGCPVIAVNATAVPEIAGQAAILVPPHSPREIAKWIIELYNNDKLLHQILECGKERAKNFSCIRSAEKFYQLFTQLA